MQIGQQIGLGMSLESLDIDVCCLSETRIQDSGEVLQIRSPSVASKGLFYVRLSGDPVASSIGLAGVDVALSARAEAALIDRIPINSRLCAVRLESSIKVRRNRLEKQCLFVISAYAPADCSPDAIKDVLPPVICSPESAFDRYCSTSRRLECSGRASRHRRESLRWPMGTRWSQVR
ncbi:unnamed protein product [Schistosoma curassoni]|nr:unnamed protein product [Schistosoma curassoni]